MIFGFALKDGDSTKFGIIEASDDEAAARAVVEKTGADKDSVTIIGSGDAASQYGGIAFLIPAEL